MTKQSIILLATLLSASPALADDPHGHYGQGHEKWHQKFYESLVKPDTNTSCCNLNDCRPTSGREKGDHYEVEVDGKWVKVLPSKVVKKTAPDWGFHVCTPANFSGNPEHVHCVVLPPEN